MTKKYTIRGAFAAYLGAAVEVEAESIEEAAEKGFAALEDKDFHRIDDVGDDMFLASIDGSSEKVPGGYRQSVPGFVSTRGAWGTMKSPAERDLYRAAQAYHVLLGVGFHREAALAGASVASAGYTAQEVREFVAVLESRRMGEEG